MSVRITVETSASLVVGSACTVIFGSRIIHSAILPVLVILVPITKIGIVIRMVVVWVVRPIELIWWIGWSIIITAIIVPVVGRIIVIRSIVDLGVIIVITAIIKVWSVIVVIVIVVTVLGVSVIMLVVPLPTSPIVTLPFVIFQ